MYPRTDLENMISSFCVTLLPDKERVKIVSGGRKVDGRIQKDHSLVLHLDPSYFAVKLTCFTHPVDCLGVS